ncbi:MAG: M48 family metalloprotease [Alphaproteobacteria bacterium]|nr:M48 family metalloprotease [Alphaproteobacteria bacterium]
MIKRFAIYLSCAALTLNLVWVPLARAQGLSLIRDAEIENILWAYTAPILRVAGIDPNAATINIVADDSLNAFVAGGPNIYLFTGLLRRSDSPEQTMGVIAHEVGHIAGSHGTRTRDLMSDLQIQGFITMILGFALAAASGQSGAAGAATLGGAGLSTNALLAHSRAQESAADSAGLTYMDDIGVSATGLYDFLKVLENEEYLAVGRQSPYYRTHPVTRERINFVGEHVRNSPTSNARLPQKFYLWHEIMRAKLTAFLESPGRVLQVYPETDNSLPARYARAIAYYRVPNLKEALPRIDELIAEHPNNPYFHELKGQMLFENGRGGEAVGPYKEAVALLPHSPLLRTQLAQVLLESGDPKQNLEALSNLKEAARYDHSNGLTYHLLSIAYGREGNIGMAALSIAEKALLEGDRDTAISQAQRAMHLLDNGSLNWLRAERVMNDAEDLDRT